MYQYNNNQPPDDQTIANSQNTIYRVFHELWTLLQEVIS